jgi:hypothetical protein
MVLQKLLHFIYPGGCLVCGEVKERINHYLCLSCQTSVKLTEHLPHLQDIYCFDECIAADVLLKHYKKNFSLHLRELLVSWMIMVFLKMDFVMPDYIVPAVIEEVAFLKRNHTNKTLAASFAKMLNLPLLDLFEYRLEDEVYNEKGELLGQLHLKSSKSLQDKTLLIIQDASSDYLEYVKLLQGTGIKKLYKIALCNKKPC